MAWTKLDDRFWCNPKVMSLSDRAFRLYVTSLNWSVANLTDGVVPAAFLRLSSMQSRNKVTRELVESGLWDEHPNGEYLIHDFADYQPTRESESQRLQAQAERQRRFRERRKAEDVTRDKAVTSRSTNTTPTRPDPKRIPDGIREPIREKAERLTTRSTELFEAVVLAVTGRPYSDVTLTKSERGVTNAAVAQLLEVDATPADVADRARRYRETWPNVSLSPSALVKHWSRFDGESVDDQCRHRWSDGRSAISTAMRGGDEVTRCNKCSEVLDVA